MRPGQVRVVPLAIALQAGAIFAWAGGADPVASLAAAIALDAVLIAALAGEPVRGARIAAWGCGLEALALAAVLLAPGGEVACAAALGVAAALRVYGYYEATLERGPLGPVLAVPIGFAVGIPLAIGPDALLRPSAAAAGLGIAAVLSFAAALTYDGSAAAAPPLARPSLPGLRLAAVALVCESLMWLISSHIPWSADVQLAAVCVGAAAIALFVAVGATVAAAGDLPRWSLAACAITAFTAVGVAYDRVRDAHAITQHAFHSAGAFHWWADAPPARAIGITLLAAAVYARGKRLPGARALAMRWTLGVVAITSLLGVALQAELNDRLELLSYRPFVEGLETARFHVDLAQLGAAFAFVALVELYRRAIESGGLPAARIARR